MEQFSVFAVPSPPAPPSPPAGDREATGGGEVGAALVDSGNAAEQPAYSPVSCHRSDWGWGGRVLLRSARKGN